jgi:hypothetical protein
MIRPSRTDQTGVLQIGAIANHKSRDTLGCIVNF